MPGRRTPSDPGDMQVSVRDDDPNQAGIQNGPARKQGTGFAETVKSGAGQFDPGEAPAESTYREKAFREDD